MKVTLESTDKVVQLQVEPGVFVPARMWEGTTEAGVPVFAFITRIAPSIENPSKELCLEFARDLRETRPPSGAVGWIPMRLIL